MKSVLVLLSAFLASPVYAFNALTMPMEYATTVSQEYAMGDTNDSSGWSSCWYENKSKTQPVVACDGTRTILVFGGHEAEVSFACKFEFKKIRNSAYEIVSEDCQ